MGVMKSQLINYSKGAVNYLLFTFGAHYIHLVPRPTKQLIPPRIQPSHISVEAKKKESMSNVIFIFVH